MMKYRAFVWDYDGSIWELNIEKEILSEEQWNKITGDTFTTGGEK